MPPIRGRGEAGPVPRSAGDDGGGCGSRPQRRRGAAGRGVRDGLRPRGHARPGPGGRGHRLGRPAVGRDGRARRARHGCARSRGRRRRHARRPRARPPRCWAGPSRRFPSSTTRSRPASLCGALAADDPLLGSLIAGEIVGAPAPVPASGGVARVVPSGGVAHAVVGLDGSDLVLVEQAPPGLPGPDARILSRRGRRPPRSGSAGDRHRVRRGTGTRTTGGRVARPHGRDARRRRSRARSTLGVEYATSRQQFGQPIGTFQAVAHPLADAADGGRRRAPAHS